MSKRRIFNPAGILSALGVTIAAAALLLPTGGAHAQGARSGIEGTAWLVEDIAGRGVIDRAQTTISFDATGRVAGSTGCNRYTGVVTIKGESLSFGPLAVTRRACVPALMDQEQKFLAAMEAVQGYAVDANGLLQLRGANSEPLLRLVVMPPSQSMVFACDEREFLVRVSTGQVELVLPDRTLVMPQVPAASGARYQEGANIFWSQGSEARFEIDGKVYSGCLRRSGD